MRIHHRILTLLLLLLLLAPACSSWRSFHHKTHTLRLIGDSTMADKPVTETPERGWGQLLPQFFSPTVRTVNYARNGRSSKSFIDQGLWAAVLHDLQPGDYLFIQFGHNDAKSSDSSRYAAPHTAYRTNLIRFIQESRARGAHPLLITPVARRYFNEQGMLENAHGDYPAVVREVAGAFQVPLVDLHASSMHLLAELGPARSEPLFMRVPPGRFAALPAGKSDNTHFMAQGAAAIARLVVQELRDSDHPLAAHLKPASAWPQPPPPSWPIPLQTAAVPAPAPPAGSKEVHPPAGSEGARLSGEMEGGRSPAGSKEVHAPAGSEGAHLPGEMEGGPVSAGLQVEHPALATWKWGVPESAAVPMAITSGRITAAEPLLHTLQAAPQAGAAGEWLVSIISGPGLSTWPANRTAPLDSVYLHYSIAPRPGAELCVTRLSLELGGQGAANMKAEVRFSVTPDFRQYATLGYTTADSVHGWLPRRTSGALQSITAAPGLWIQPGGAFYLRIYPWIDGNAHPTAGKYLAIGRVAIHGFTRPAVGRLPGTAGTDSIDSGLPVIITPEVSQLSTTSAFGRACITADGGDPVVERGFCWNSQGVPTTADPKVSAGQGTGSFAAAITGLAPGRHWHLRAYAISAAGTAYGEEIEFTTLKALTAPEVSTRPPEAIRPTSASSGGTVIAWGGDTLHSRGLCWNTRGEPTITDAQRVCGSGLGDFAAWLEPLQPATTYHVRAWAANDIGIGYGESLRFTTPAVAPTVTRVVAGDGSGDYRSVQAAFDAIPDYYPGTYYILVKAGRYHEKLRLPASRPQVILMGEGAERTILSYDDYAGKPGVGGTVNSASAAIDADDFCAVDITFENTVRNDGSFADQQAVALRLNGDRQSFYHCRILGYQDTFFAWHNDGPGRVYLNHCTIAGSVDFIFGRGIVLFDSCGIRVNREGGIITAASTDPESRHGLIFRDCELSADSTGFDGRPVRRFLLGRPWQSAPRTVFLRCQIPAAVDPAGWISWNVAPALYAEYGCYGGGAATDRRAPFSRQLTEAEAEEYTITAIFSRRSHPAFGSDWRPVRPMPPAGWSMAAASGDPAWQQPGIVDGLPHFTAAARSRLHYPHSWLSGNFTDFDAWRCENRELVRRHLLAEPPPAPPNLETLAEEERGTYTARKVLFNLHGWSRVPAYLLVPRGAGPFPAVLLLHDHGARFDIGKEKMVRPFGEAAGRSAAAQEWVNGQYDGRFIGDELAQRGYLCLATDALNWGDRGGAGKEGQQALASNLLNLGLSLAGLVAWEDLAALRLLAALPQVDKERIAAVGHSFGAFRAWQLAALSDEIAAAVAVCWMGSRNELLVPGNNLTRGQSAYTTTHPGLANWLDYPDVASLAAPKPLLVFSGAKDPLFPQPAVLTAMQKMRRVWESRRAGQNLVTRVWPVGHQFTAPMQEEAFLWLDRQLMTAPISFSARVWAQLMDHDGGWFATPEAREIAHTVQRYQCVCGGWPKNVDMTRPLDGTFTKLALPRPDTAATIDNGATWTQLFFLARVISAAALAPAAAAEAGPGAGGDAWAAAGAVKSPLSGDAAAGPALIAAFNRGLDYLFAAQYANGGWPQFYPLHPGYYSHITYNDDAMVGVLSLLKQIADGHPAYTFVDAGRRERARRAMEQGIACILATQLRDEAGVTAWCAQYDEHTLQPAAARAYELVSLSGDESAGIVRFLLSIESPTPEVIAAIEGAMAWFERVKIKGIRVDQVADATSPVGFNKVVVEDPAAPPMWARFYLIGSNRLFFSDRDGKIYYDMAHISSERRNEYAWLGYWPQRLLELEYPAWRRRHLPDSP